MFNVKHILNFLKGFKLHEIFFFVFLFLIPIQVRILYFPEQAYVSWYFNYHQAIFIYLTDLILIACFTSWLMFDFPRNISKTANYWLILTIIGVISLGMFHVKHLNLALYDLLKWIEMFLIILYIQTNFKTHLYYIYGVVLVYLSGVVQSIIAVSQFHVQHSLGLNWLGEYIAPIGTSGLSTVSHETEKIIRAYGTMPHPNVLAGFLIVSLIFGLYLISKTNIHKWIVSCGTILILLGIFVTFSRAAWLVSVLTLICFILYYWLTKAKINVVYILIIGIVSCGTIFILGNDYLISRVSNIDIQSITGRVDYNRMSLELVKHNWLIGTGVGDYIETLKQMFHVQPWQYQPAHNIFIVFAAQFGILGLILFVKLLFNVLSGLRNIRRETLIFTCLLAFIMVLLISQVDHYFITIQQGRLIFFVLIGLLAGLPNIYKNEKIQL